MANTFAEEPIEKRAALALAVFLSAIEKIESLGLVPKVETGTKRADGRTYKCYAIVRQDNATVGERQRVRKMATEFHNEELTATV